MVHKIIKLESKYRVFIESLILTSLILIIGFSIGFYVESNRTQSIANNYKNFEIDVLDLKLQNYYYQIMDSASCKVATNQNLDFADNLYTEGLKIEKYEQANVISNDILLEKKKYVLMKTELWLNSIVLKKKCGNSFNTLAYIYTQNPTIDQEAVQKATSNVLSDIKKERGNNVVLIPIAGDLGLASVTMQLEAYNVTSLPSIIINEKVVLQGFQTKENLEKYLD